MFSKALLLLAVCFQVLRTGNSAMHVEEIKDGWQEGKTLNVKIEAHEEDQPSCKIMFQDERRDAGNFLLLTFDGSHSRFFIMSYVNGKWQKGDNEKDIEIPNPITVDVMAEEKNWKITFKSKEYLFPYDLDLPKEDIKFMQVQCPNGEITVTSTWSKV